MSTDVFEMVYRAAADHQVRYRNLDDAWIVLHPRRYHEVLTSECYYEFCSVDSSGHQWFGRPLASCAALREDQVLIVVPPDPQTLEDALTAVIHFCESVGNPALQVGCSRRDVSALLTHDPGRRVRFNYYLQPVSSTTLLGTTVCTDASLPPGIFWLKLATNYDRVTAVVRRDEVEWLNILRGGRGGIGLAPLPFPRSEFTRDRFLQREALATAYGVPAVMLGSPSDLFGDGPNPAITVTPVEREPFGEPGGEPAIDICDEISALVDDQLTHESSGYNHNLNQPRCACGEPWHGLPITEKMQQMRTYRTVEDGYVYADDTSPVLCPGTPKAGTWKGPIGAKSSIPSPWHTAFIDLDEMDLGSFSAGGAGSALTFGGRSGHWTAVSLPEEGAEHHVDHCHVASFFPIDHIEGDDDEPWTWTNLAVSTSAGELTVPPVVSPESGIADGSS